MHSIRARIISLTMTAILVSVAALGVIAFLSIRREVERSSAETMRLICDERRRSIDDYLDSIEQTQDIVAHFAATDMSMAVLAEGDVLGADGWGTKPLRESDMADQDALDKYLKGYVNRVEDVFLSAVSNTEGVISFYYRINPEISMTEKGFLYSRVSNVSFGEIELTDLSLYDPDDDEHVGWYYTPLRRGTASWLDPYDNKNLGIKMVSYETPIYKANTFIGVVGVDISYKTLVDMIRDIRIYETDYAVLLEPNGTILYHPTVESGQNLSEGNAELAKAVELMQAEDSNMEPIRYTLNGVKRQLFFATLSSGQKLAVTAPVKEINASWSRLGYRLAFVAILLLVVFTEIAAVTVRRITQPLQRLTDASRSIAQGNYNVRLDAGGNDEVGTLTQAFQQLVDQLKIYISDLNSMAYRDAMTGVKNKAAYAISAQKLNDLIRMNGADNAPEFALIMFDCNNLKQINDNYGHEKGDIYLRTACRLICDVFPHSPVFRVGGDEFVALLTEHAFDEREALMKEFDRQADVVNAGAQEPWERVFIAKGMAAYDPAQDTDVESVLHRADELMYEHKKRVKAGRA